ncbi:MAG TPA: tetratricopeptide repeat protein [Myxococcota bacterium]
MRFQLALALTMSGLLLAGPALASVESELAFHRGVVAYGQNHLDEARALFEKVVELDPSDTVAIHYLALIAIKQGDRTRARELIEKGLALEPDDPDLRVDLGVLQLEAGLTAEARESFDRVLAVRPDDARAQLFAGIAAYRAGAYAAAMPHLDRAVELDPNLELQARYYAGLSEAFLGNLPVAEGAFDEIASQSPQHPLSQSAQRLRDQIRTPEPERPWTLSLSAGGEYDSNPLLAGETIPRDSDYRGVWRARGSYRVFEKDGFTLSAGAEGYWSIHHEADQVDLQTYLGFANASYSLGPVLFGLNYDFVYTFIDFDDPFRMVNRITPSVSVREGDIGLTQLYYQYQHMDFFENTQTPAFDIDGHEQFVGLSQYFFLPAPVSYLRLGALGDFANTSGTEFQYTGYELFAGSSLALPFDSQFDVLYRYADRNFDYDSFFFPNQHQHAKIHRVTLELIKTITPHIDVSLAGSLAFRDSNIPVYDYNRYIGGGYVTYRF